MPACRTLVIRHDVRDESRLGAIQRELQSFIESLQAGACRAQPDMTSHSNDKQLACTLAAGEKQKTWFAGLRREVFEGDQPYAIVNADTPHDLFHVLGVPVVTNQWWAAVGDKRLSEEYLDAMNARATREPLQVLQHRPATSKVDPASAPLGAACPSPHCYCARLTCDCSQRIFQQWADQTGALLPARSAWHLGAAANWWGSRATAGKALRAPPPRLRGGRLAAHHRARRHWGRRFDADELRVFLQRVNEQGRAVRGRAPAHRHGAQSAPCASPSRSPMSCPRSGTVAASGPGAMRAASARKCRRVSMLASLSAPLSASA